MIDASEMELKEQQPATFSVTVDLVPEFKLPKYEGIPLKVTEKEVKDSDVEEQLQRSSISNPLMKMWKAKRLPQAIWVN